MSLDSATSQQDAGQKDAGGAPAAGPMHQVMGRRWMVAAGHPLAAQAAARILAALARLEDDSYGICLDCQELIAPARLLALPEVERCVRCQDDHERTAVRTRTAEETELDAPDD